MWLWRDCGNWHRTRIGGGCRGAVRLDRRLIGEFLVLVIARLALEVLPVEFRRVSVDGTLFADCQTMNWQREIFFPALHGANFAPQVRSYLAPGLEPALLGLSDPGPGRSENRRF